MGFTLLAHELEIEVYFIELYFPSRGNLDEVKTLPI